MNKYLALAFALVCGGSAFAQTNFDANKVRVLSRIPLSAMPTAPTSGAGCTGYVSPAGREYAIMGVRTGTLIVDVTTPQSPEVMSHITGSTSLWHENVVYGDYGYFVSDQTGTGLQIVNLSNLDSGRTASLVRTYNENGLQTIHTIQTNPVTRTLYLNGSNKGLVFLDVTDPENPVWKGSWGTKYVHDSVPVNYTSGPYAGREILFACCGQDGLFILDVTDKAAPVVLGNLSYLQAGTYCHSGALTADKRYFLINDEFDENQGSVSTCTTHVIDVQDLTAPNKVGTFSNPLQVIDHNTKWQDGFLMLAAYRGGMRVYDPTNPLGVQERGYFDTYPGANAFSYDGNWGVHPFPSGTVIASDINRGLFVLDPSEAKGQGAPLTAVTSSAQITGDPVKALRLQDGLSFPLRLTSARSFITADFASSSKTRSFLDITVAAQVTSDVQATIYARNSSGNYIVLGTGTITSGTGSVTLTSIPASAYLTTRTNVLDSNTSMTEYAGSIRVALTTQDTNIASVPVNMIRVVVR